MQAGSRSQRGGDGCNGGDGIMGDSLKRLRISLAKAGGRALWNSSFRIRRIFSKKGRSEKLIACLLRRMEFKCFRKAFKRGAGRKTSYRFASKERDWRLRWVPLVALGVLHERAGYPGRGIRYVSIGLEKWRNASPRWFGK